MEPTCYLCRDLTGEGIVRYYIPLPVQTTCRRCKFFIRLINQFVPEDEQRDLHSMELSIHYEPGRRCRVNISQKVHRADGSMYPRDITYVDITKPKDSAFRPPMWPQLAATRRKVARDSGDISCIQFIRDNLQNCCSCHEISCSASGPGELPRRLIDIGSHSSSVYLKEDHSEDGGLLYSALSYCWGDPTKLLLTKTTNIEQHKRGIPREELPQTIQDAMSISLQLGLKYMWIDCLCIIQDDKSDWETEASRMGTYFSEAHITIAASASKDACSGIFAQMTEYPDSHAIEMEDDEGVVQILDAQRRPDFDDDFGNIDVLGERAWAFQENILSRRVAHFTGAGVIWECSGSILFEDGWPPIGFEVFKSCMRAPQSLLSYWGRLVDAYSRRQLTFAEDKLPALSGVAALISGTAWGGHRYVAGLWEETLLYDLLWYSYRNTRPFGVLNKPINGPSWTWASVDGPVGYFHSDPKDGKPQKDLSAIINIDCVSQGMNPFAGFVEGCIEIEGPVTRATITFKGNENTIMGFDLGFENMNDIGDPEPLFSPDTALDAVESYVVRPSGLPGLRRVNTVPKPFKAELTCLWICTQVSSRNLTYGLAIAELESRPGYFTRVGYLQCYHDSTWLLSAPPGSRRRVFLV